MKPALLTLNAGSSSLKFSFFSITDDEKIEKIFYGSVEALDERPRFQIKNKFGEIIQKKNFTCLPR